MISTSRLIVTQSYTAIATGFYVLQSKECMIMSCDKLMGKHKYFLPDPMICRCNDDYYITLYLHSSKCADDKDDVTVS